MRKRRLGFWIVFFGVLAIIFYAASALLSNCAYGRLRLSQDAQTPPHAEHEGSLSISEAWDVYDWSREQNSMQRFQLPIVREAFKVLNQEIPTISY